MFVKTFYKLISFPKYGIINYNGTQINLFPAIFTTSNNQEIQYGEIYQTNGILDHVQEDSEYGSGYYQNNHNTYYKGLEEVDEEAEKVYIKKKRNLNDDLFGAEELTKHVEATLEKANEK